ncbi:MAG: class I SAM-dependent methyltransferase [Ilumatobacteraceae bacterium]
MAETVWDHIRSSYDDVADAYEARFADELDRKPADRELLEHFAAVTTGPVVDLGCGPGHIGSFVRSRDEGPGPVIGLDLSGEMARRARRRLDAVVVADLRALPFADRSIGGIVALYSLIHVRRAELPRALGEVHRVLRPGGRVVLSAHEGTTETSVEDFLGRPAPVIATLFSLDELVTASADAALDVARAERRPPYPNEGTTTRLYIEARRPPD